MLKSIALASVLGTAGLVVTGVLPCPCEALTRLGSCCAPDGACDDAPSGLYLEARDVTVWGGACHVGSQAVSQGQHAVQGWAFERGAVDGVDLSGVRIAAAIEGDANLQAREVFRSGDAATVRSMVWVDAPSAEARDAAVAYVSETVCLGDVLDVVEADVRVTRDGDAFALAVPGVLDVSGAALADRSCCSMPESRWYAPLAETTESVVGNPASCRFEGVESLGRWAFEGENSVFVARFGA
ncbi:MAG: hypothetical protein AAGA20_22285 [Planctomycetota bacterium]